MGMIHRQKAWKLQVARCVTFSIPPHKCVKRLLEPLTAIVLRWALREQTQRFLQFRTGRRMLACRLERQSKRRMHVGSPGRDLAGTFIDLNGVADPALLLQDVPKPKVR